MNNEQLRTYCMSLPGTTEGIKWDDHICFMVGEKIFCITGINEATDVRLKVSEEDFFELTEREGVEQAAYFAKKQWVAVYKRKALAKEEWKHYLFKSYELIKAKLPKKIREQL